MDDPRPYGVAQRRQFRRQSQERVDQRPAGVPRRGVNGKPGRLIDDDDVIVLIDDRKWYALGRRPRFLNGRDGGHDTGAGGETMGRPLLSSVHRDQAILNEAASLAAGEFYSEAGEKDIQPLARPISRQLQRLHVRL